MTTIRNFALAVVAALVFTAARPGRQWSQFSGLKKRIRGLEVQGREVLEHIPFGQVLSAGVRLAGSIRHRRQRNTQALIAR